LPSLRKDRRRGVQEQDLSRDRESAALQGCEDVVVVYDETGCNVATASVKACKLRGHVRWDVALDLLLDVARPVTPWQVLRLDEEFVLAGAKALT
jgi:hypothetical protein